MSAKPTDDKPIDIVITWVDGNDPAWRLERARYTEGSNNNVARDVDTREYRYCPWDTLRYLFRGIEECADWVRTVHLVTWGHLPEWLNVDCKRLNVVRHKDFIPSKYLPTFSSHAIEFNLHRIAGLAERFVYFNDDMLFLKPTKKSDFFHGDFPCDTAVHTPLKVTYGDWFYAPQTNVAILNQHFKMRQSMMRKPFQWFNPKYGLDLMRTLLMLPYPEFFGLRSYHIPYSFTKQTFQELWEAEPEILDNVCSHRFRVTTDPNPWLLQGWQIASGNFYPRSIKFGEQFHIKNLKDAERAVSFIHKRSRSVICLNDSIENNEDGEVCRSIVEAALSEILSLKSGFEK